MDLTISAEHAQQLAWAILARAALYRRGAVAILLAAQGPDGAADILARATPAWRCAPKPTSPTPTASAPG
ncbi:hypothetical protein ACFWM1_26310 [Nocardia sp. NPDC058379]|uniref:hypothetical protein n=1 Tax=unclassified Nocardia TaxID=2637762 RepID=UPI00364CCD65